MLVDCILKIDIFRMQKQKRQTKENYHNFTSNSSFIFDSICYVIDSNNNEASNEVKIRVQFRLNLIWPVDCFYVIPSISSAYRIK